MLIMRFGKAITLLIFWLPYLIISIQELVHVLTRSVRAEMSRTRDLILLGSLDSDDPSLCLKYHVAMVSKFDLFYFV